MKQIIIEKDGWVYIKDGKLEQGLGDIGVDVEIVDKRTLKKITKDQNN